MANLEHRRQLERGVRSWNTWRKKNPDIQPDLSGTYLDGLRMSGTYLIGANLSGANLSGAYLVGANLSNTNLDGANLSGVHLEATIIANVDLRTTKGLAEIIHRGPSPVSLYSVQLPQDGSVLHFLRGAGVPDEWIEDYRIRMMHSAHYYSCFISYSSEDDPLARRLHADLQDKGVRCWFA